MENTAYETALWGKSWDEVYGESPDALEQGIANLTDGDVLLEIPFGELLGTPGKIHIGGREDSLPESVDYLYGFSQKGTTVPPPLRMTEEVVRIVCDPGKHQLPRASLSGRPYRGYRRCPESSPGRPPDRSFLDGG